MKIADQFRKKSLEVNNRKSQQRLAKTLAEKKKKAESLAKKVLKKKIAQEKERESKKIAQEEEKERDRLENIRLKNNLIIKNYLERFIFLAWKGDLQVVINEKEIENSHLFEKYGLYLLSTEEFVSKINKQVDAINNMIFDLEKVFLKNIPMHQVEKDNFQIPKICPEYILDETFVFEQHVNYLYHRIDYLNRDNAIQIRNREKEYHSLSSNGSYPISQISKYAEILQRIAEPFKKNSPTFQSFYLDQLANSPNAVGDRRQSFQIAQRVFLIMGITLPSINDLRSDLTNFHDLGDSNIDIIGRYMAFFRVMGGDDPYQAITENVNEKFAIENEKNFSNDTFHIKRLAKEIEILKFQGVYSSKFLNSKINSINIKFNTLKKYINLNKFSIPYNSKYFQIEFLYDLNKIRNFSKGDKEINEIVDEIKFLVIDAGFSYTKLIKVIDIVSSNGLYCLILKFVDHGDKVVFIKNNRKFLTIPVSVQSFLKLLLACGFGYAVKEHHSYSTITIKW